MKAKRSARYLLQGAFVLIALPFLVVFVENTRTRLAWQRLVKQSEARGESYALDDLLPPQVPDAENFASTPLLSPVFDFVPDPETGHSSIRDWEAFEQAKLVFRWTRNCSGSGLGWRNAEFARLADWQTSLREAANRLPEVPKPKPRLSETAPDPKLAVLRNLPMGAPADDILKVIGTIEREMDELCVASHRPHAKFPIRYQEGYAMLLPHLAYLKDVTRALQARALAHLDKGDTEGALSDVLAGLRLSDAIRSDRIVVSQLVRYATYEIMIQPIWEGMARQQWNERQLRDLQSELSKGNCISEMAIALRGERALILTTLDLTSAGKFIVAGEESDTKVFRFVPSCVFYGNKSTIAQIYQDYFLPVFDGTNGCIDITAANRNAAAVAAELNSKSPYKMFAKIMLPGLEKVAPKTAMAQATANLAVTACALERFRLAEGEYPASLDQLSPRYLAAVPVDPVNGDSLHYRQPAGGRFVLYSIGTDLSDNSSDVRFEMEDDKTKIDHSSGDWVWRYPESAN